MLQRGSSSRRPAPALLLVLGTSAALLAPTALLACGASADGKSSNVNGNPTTGGSGGASTGAAPSTGATGNATGGVANGSGGLTSGGTSSGGTSSAGGGVNTGGTTSTGGGVGNADILAPDSGALLGLYYGDDDIETTAGKLGRTPPVHLTYYDFHHDWTGNVTQADLAAGRIPLVNWEVFSATLDDILAGDYDEMLAERAAAAKALGKKFFLDFGAEMNGEWSPWGGAQNGESAEKYVATFRYVFDALAEADNVVWLWCPNVTDEPHTDWNETFNYYPGDEYVDWTCVDGYNWGDAGGGGWQSFYEVFEDIYPKLAAKNKPIMIGEMASAEGGGSKVDFIDGMVPTLENDFPMIKGLVWFDIDKETDWRISSSETAESAFVSMANDPYMMAEVPNP